MCIALLLYLGLGLAPREKRQWWTLCFRYAVETSHRYCTYLLTQLSLDIISRWSSDVVDSTVCSAAVLRLFLPSFHFDHWNIIYHSLYPTVFLIVLETFTNVFIYVCMYASVHYLCRPTLLKSVLSLCLNFDACKASRWLWIKAKTREYIEAPG